ncbi:MAG TPA: SPOR domain-containing protein [Candidatus Krumholzibacteria bacterium]|nr:SPOR domain-containing protein [Candidatus Krumholzibacteria bacterium]
MRVSASSRSHRRAIALGILLLATAGPVSAQSGAGTYAAPFLKIPVGARLMSSPDAVAGMSPDASLMYANPAFLTGMSRTQAFVSTTEWLDDLVFSAAGVALPIGNGGTVVSFGTTFLYSGGLKGYNDALAVVSEENFYSAGFDLSVAHDFRGTGLSLALGASYIREHVFPQDGSGYTFNVGASYWNGPNLIHASARDLGGQVTYASGTWEVAPEMVIGGGRVFNSRVGQFFAGTQVANSDAYGTRLQFGVDYQMNQFFTLRSGVTDNLDSADGLPLNAGFGLRYGAMAVEYAYTPQEYFSSTHTFSLSYSFGMESRGPAAGPVTVPAGDFAPPVANSEPLPPVKPGTSRPERAATYVILAGSHAWLESAQAEARALEILKIPAKVESEGTRFRVVVGRYETQAAADRALAQYRSLGHVFRIVTD